MLQSICQLETCLKEVINENPNVITNENVKNIIMRKRGYFQDVQDLAAIIKPIRDLIIQLEGQEANLADCFFSLAQLGAAIKNMPELDHKMFYRHYVESLIIALMNLILTNICLHIICILNIKVSQFYFINQLSSNELFIYNNKK